MPSVDAGFFDAENYLNSCVYSRVQSCIAGDYEGLVEVRTLGDGEEISKYVVSLSDGAVAYATDEKQEVCVEVRARDLSGRRSKARSFCSETKSLPVLPLDDGAWSPACSTEMVEALHEAAQGEGEAPAGDANGCALSPVPPQAPSALWFIGVGMGAGSFVRRKRRSVREVGVTAE